MSSPNNSNYTPIDLSDSSSDDSRHFLIGVVVTVTFLIIIVTMTVVAYFIGRRRGLAGVLVNPSEERHVDDSDVEKGLDEATLGAFPKLLFSGGKATAAAAGETSYSTASSCSVCLADYGEKEWLRVLPDCGHVFHLKCVDSWLRIHPTCPVCRKLPSSVSTSPEKC